MRIYFRLLLSCSLILAGCSTIQENVTTLVQSVPLPGGEGSAEGATGSISLSKIETPKVNTTTVSGAAQWPNSCDRVHWPAGIAKAGPGALKTVANVMEFAGFKGATQLVEGGTSFVNLISDMEMSLPDTTKQAYIYRALGGERNLVSPLSAYRFGDFNLASAKASAISNQTKAQHGPRSLEYASSLALLATVHTDSGFAESNDRAQGYWKEAAAIFREQGSATAEGAALIASGRLLVRQGNLRGILSVVDRLLSLPDQSEPLKMMALPLSAQLDVADGNPTAAFRKLATALQYWDSQLTQGQATTLDISRNLFGPFLEEGLFSTVPQLEGALVLTQAAEILTGMGQEKAALKLLDAALTKTRGSAAHYRPERVDIFIETAETAVLANDSGRASSALKSARNMHWWNLVLYNRAVANRSYAQGLERLKAGDYAEAEIWLRHALGWWQTDLGSSAEALRPLNALSRLYLKMGQQQLAA
ncbi:MAG: hypothetical protein B7Y80_19630 [Hyphomicrobium sp. 32-62-53]|nr:MAG: hypothetical protein B7Z29_19830 [Hyphomicrobium sp. 12-62-95]OYX97475.1 MAG: hypothetical protein B7Y80_19630 [Hyphomicrobium sp. 32-62-53]